MQRELEGARRQIQAFEDDIVVSTHAKEEMRRSLMSAKEECERTIESLRRAYELEHAEKLALQKEVSRIREDNLQKLRSLIVSSVFPLCCFCFITAS